MKEYNFFKLQGAVRPTAEQLLDTKLFYQNSVEIYARFNDWKDNDRFYFTPLYMQMTYSGRNGTGSGMAWILCERSPEPPGTVPVQVPEMRQDRIPLPNCGLSPFRPSGFRGPMRVWMEGVRVRQWLAGKSQCPTRPFCQRRFPAWQIQAFSPCGQAGHGSRTHRHACQ